MTAGTGSRLVRQGLVWVEVALAVVLLVGAGLFISSFARLMRVDHGFDASGLMSFAVSLPREPGATPQHAPTIDAMLESLRRLPSTSAEFVAAGGAPFEGGYSSFPVQIAGRPALPPGPDGSAAMIRHRKVSAGFFDILRIPIRIGRAFRPDDGRQGPPVAVVNEAAVRDLWAGGSPLGDRLTIERVQYEIVGVAADVRYHGPQAAAVPEVFLPYEHSVFSGGTFLIRSGEDPLRSLPAIKAALWSVSPKVPLRDVRTADELFARVTASHRFNMLLMTIFGALALVIAATGTYGIIAFVVHRRTHEIGVRLALGADGPQVVRLFVREGAVIVALGLAAGLVGAWWLAQTVRGFLFEVQPRDPLVFALVVACLGGVGLLACWLPARRAARVDPLVALRAE